MEDFFDKTGVMAIGTRLRMLSERVTKESEKIFALYNVDIKPKWYPVFFSLLQDEKPKTVTSIANEIGHSHVSVVKLVKEISKAGLLIEQKDEFDGRKTNIFLSSKGKEVAKGLEEQHKDTTIAIEKMLSNTKHNLWLAIDEFEELLDEQSTYPRVLKEQRIRESSNVRVVEFEEKYQKCFEKLNKQWIKEFFVIEEKDKYSLENPKETIINKGGVILVALYDDKPIGVCSLIKLENRPYDFELSKMAISKDKQRKGIGLILVNSIIKKAKELNSKSIFLETNTILKPAINLYKKVGFKQIRTNSSSYDRSNYQMELILE